MPRGTATPRTRAIPVVLTLTLLLASAPVLAQPPTLESRIRAVLEEHKGSIAVAVKHLERGESFTHRADEPMPTASLIKVAVMVEAYRQADAGTVDLTQMIALKDDDKVQGSGVLTQHFSAGLQLSLRDAIRLMIAYSDNTATNLVLDRIGLGATAAAMEQLGLPNTKLHAKVFRADTSLFPERSREFGLGSTTAAEMLQLLERLHKGELASPSATRDMLEHLRACQDKNMLPRRLPPGTKIAHKTGSVSAVRTAAGIIDSPSGPLLIVVLTAENEDRRWADDNAAELVIARIARAAYDHFNPPSAVPSPSDAGELQLGSSGWLVEALQRTLNERLAPAPGLTVDGDFGPVTQRAVVAFQQSKQLAATGTVDAPTWKALGPLLTSARAVTDPDELDLSLPDKQPTDPVDGLPFVTCKAWAVADAKSGEVFGGANAGESVEIASTTKLMTAWLILRRLEQEPGLLDEVATVSARAAETNGSSANLRAGERLTIRDLLHGLLLPSGNDASVVIAEHFGGRFDPPADHPGETDPLPRFVAEMNRTAESLGMSGTQYRNPHGLSAEGHRSTARDLVSLAAVLVNDGRILPYVQTRKHVGRLEGAAGYVRYELWTNTNRLLDINGYLGMKTGTTTPAGACLVSLGERGDERLICVVLGATSSDARYTDTRNLFRWAWQQRGEGQ
jgi:D-alanyl-D-alanine carboxypeptidase (penicillin-binding protein 5/6)